MKRVLFVDGSPRVLEGLEHTLHPLRHEWDMDFAASSREALWCLTESKYDVLVTSIHMPEVDGIALLSEAIRICPQTVRIILCGKDDPDVVLRSVSLAHQYLVKPCDAHALQATVEKALALRNILDNPSLAGLIGRIKSLPSPPTVYYRLMQAVLAEDISASEVGSVIAQDLGMTAKVLQMANSALFGIQRQITDPTQAVIYLGPEMVRQLVLVASAFSAFQPKSLRHFSIERLQIHSLAVGGLARRIAQSLELSPAALDYAFVGGLLHDVGKLLLACNYPERYDEAMRHASEEGVLDRIAEVQTFGTTHAEVGAYLLWLWALPDPITEIVLRHHEFPADPAAVYSPSVAVHVADALGNGGFDPDAVACLTAVGLGEKLAGWQRSSRETRLGRGSHVEAHPVCGR